MIFAGRHSNRIVHAKIAKTDTDGSLLFLALLGALGVLGVMKPGLVPSCPTTYSPDASADVKSPTCPPVMATSWANVMGTPDALVPAAG